MPAVKPRRPRSKALLATAILLAAASAWLTGCGGPTKAGMQARTDARDRVSLVNAQIGYDQALRAFEVGQFDRAMREISASIDRSPNQPEFHLLQGRIHLEEHRLEPAARCFTRAIEIAHSQDWKSSPVHAPHLAKAHYFAGIVQQRWSDYSRAHESYAAAADIEPSNVQYLLAAAESLVALERYDEAVALIEPSRARFEHNAALRHLLGQIALLQDDPHRAVALLTEARLLSPEDPLLLEELARAQFAAEMFGRCHDSLRLLRRMVASGGDAAGSFDRRADLLHMEARCLVLMDRHADARRVYLELTELAPGEVEPWIEFGAVAYEIGDLRRLATAAGRVVALAPDRWEGPFLQAMYEMRMAEQSGAADAEAIDRAVRLLRQAARRAEGPGASTVPHLVLGRMLEQRGRQGDNDAAMAAYAQAKRIDPNDPQAQALFAAVSSRLASVPVE